MATIEADIDELYQCPLAEFTPMRNALARRAGSRASKIKALQKPSAAAWAVNQLYWRRRDTFNALASASDARRKAHVRRIDGKSAGLDAADGQHRAALAAALKTTIAFLKDAADPVSPATMAAVVQTLEAVPSPEVQGRLAHAIAAAGLSVLMGLMSSATSTGDARSRAAGPQPKAAPARQEVERARRSADTTRRERVQVERELRDAQHEERDATGALTTARHAVQRADQQIERLEDQLREARATAGIQRDEVERFTRAVSETTTERTRLERRLRELD